MGLYDNIVCKMKLPGKDPAWLTPDSVFQTKSLDCTMSTYTINADGTFSDSGYVGKIQFHNSNVVGVGPGVYTKGEEAAEEVTYEVSIVDGRVTELVQTDYTHSPAWPVSKMRENIYQESELPELVISPGQRLYVLYGGQEKGYWVTVLLKRGRQICVEVEGRSGGDRLELHDVREANHLIWESEEIALGREAAKKQWWDDKHAEYKAFVAANGGVRH